MRQKWDQDVVFLLIVSIPGFIALNIPPTPFDFRDFLSKIGSLEIVANSEEELFVSDQCIQDLTYFGERLVNPLGFLEPGSGGQWPLKSGEVFWLDWIPVWETPDGRLHFYFQQVADAMGKYPTDGFFTLGNFIALGSYSSCTELDAKFDTPAQKGHFQGQYCYMSMLAINQTKPQEPTLKEIQRAIDSRRLNLMFPGGMSFLNVPEARSLLSSGLTRFGTCFPNSCSRSEVASLMSLYSLMLSTESETWIVQPMNCIQSRVKDPLKFPDIVFIIFLSGFVLLTLIGTCFDWAHRVFRAKSQDSSKSWFIGFSLYSNCGKLFETSGHGTLSENTDRLSCLDGIRFLSMTWVLLSHVYSACFSQIPVKNFFHLVDEFVEPFLFRTVLNGFVCVDSFFLLSGILTAYLTFKELDKTHGRLNVPLFYLHRYLRLTGVYAMLVFFMATIYRYLELGPTSFVNAEVTMCQDTWYRNLFYFNNFQGSDGYCLGHTWYLASDFQFFLVSPLVMIPMWWIQRKWNRSFWTLVYPLVWLIVFTFVIVGLTIANDWPLSSAVAVLDTDYSEHGYVTPWCRCQPYIVGIMLGYILHRSRGQPIQLSWALSYWMWILATATALAILWGVDAHSVWQGAERSSLLASVFYNAGSRLAWALALGWLILACSKNLPGSYWISRFLGWEGFIPLSRLTYCIFLCHLVVTSTLLSFIDYNVYMTHYLATVMILACFTFSLVISVLMALIVEIPCLNAEKRLLQWIRTKKLGGKVE